MNWTIDTLFFGTIQAHKEFITPGLDNGLIFNVPYLGFYLTNGKRHILCDTGINEKYIIDGKAWLGSPAAGGSDWVLGALKGIGLSPDDIDTVIYTHLHNDHAGNCELFPNAVHVFQEAEWKEYIDPLPSMVARGDYDQSLIEVFRNLKTQRLVGDTRYLEGLEVILTPGHTLGSQCLLVQTKDGIYNIAGDTVNSRFTVFPEMDSLTLIDGKVIPITPAPKSYGPAIASWLIYDQHDWFRSIYRIKSMLQSPRHLLPGHETSIVNKKYG